MISFHTCVKAALLSQVTSFANGSEFRSGMCNGINMQKEYFSRCFSPEKKKKKGQNPDFCLEMETTLIPMNLVAVGKG